MNLMAFTPCLDYMTQVTLRKESYQDVHDLKKKKDVDDLTA